MVYRWINLIQNRLLPAVCLLCGAPGEAPGRDLCAGCRRYLPLNAHACPRCAEPLPASAPAGTVCGRCRRLPPPFAAAFAPYRYDWPLDRLIVELKFRRRLAVARVLGTLFAEALAVRLAAGAPRPQALVPVPLHPKRLAARGYNQAAELARPVARMLGLPLLDAGRRVRDTAAQSALAFRERRRNVAGAFVLAQRVPHAHIALIDDVLTTGHTAGECARALQAGGVERVEVWTLARTPAPGKPGRTA